MGYGIAALGLQRLVELLLRRWSVERLLNGQSLQFREDYGGEVKAPQPFSLKHRIS